MRDRLWRQAAIVAKHSSENSVLNIHEGEGDILARQEKESVQGLLQTGVEAPPQMKKALPQAERPFLRHC